MEKEIITAVAIGLGLAASCGFRVFVPMLVASVAAKMGIFPVHEGFQWLASWPAIISFGTSILSLVIPLIIAALLILLIIYFIMKFGEKIFKHKTV
jgi:hypothetical protein